MHVVDVAARVHAGYVAVPGSIPGPQGVATRRSLVAVTSWGVGMTGSHVVRLFEGAGSVWTPLRVIGAGFGAPGCANGQLERPLGLRFTADGTGLTVADCRHGRVGLFATADGSFVAQLATGLVAPVDVEECEGGWSRVASRPPWNLWVAMV